MKKFVLFILLFFASLCYAEEVKVLLRSGTVMTGSLILQNEEIVVLQSATGTRYQLPTVEVVKIGTQEEIQQIQQEQATQKDKESQSVDKASASQNLPTSVTVPSQVQATSQRKQSTLVNAGYNDPATPITPSNNTSGMILRDNGHYMYNGTYIDSKEVERLLSRNAAARKQWDKARGMTIGGAVLCGTGVGLALGSLAWITYSSSAALGICGAGAIIAIPGCVLLGVGAGQRSKAIDIYNFGNEGTMSLNVTTGCDGIGIAINF